MADASGRRGEKKHVAVTMKLEINDKLLAGMINSDGCYYWKRIEVFAHVRLTTKNTEEVSVAVGPDKTRDRSSTVLEKYAETRQGKSGKSKRTGAARRGVRSMRCKTARPNHLTWIFGIERGSGQR